MTDRERLIAKIVAQGIRAGDVVVSLEDFFVGNDDRGSIGCNLGNEQPAISTFFQMLLAIRSKPQVQDVVVRVCEFDNPHSWPYSDTIYLLTSASLEEVQQWVAPLKPTRYIVSGCMGGHKLRRLFTSECFRTAYGGISGRLLPTGPRYVD